MATSKPNDPLVKPPTILLPTSTVASMPLPSVVWHKEVATFTDPVLECVLDIPSRWQISPRLGPPTSATPSTFGTNIPRRYPLDLRPHNTQIQILPGPAPVHTLDEIRQNVVLSSTEILVERETALHGLPTLWFETEMTMPETGAKYPVTQLFVLINDHSAQLTVYGNSAPAISVINSMRSIHETVPSPVAEEPLLPVIIWQNEIAIFTDPVLGLALEVPSNWLIYPRLELPAIDYSAFESPCFNGAPIPVSPCTQLTISYLPSFNNFDDAKEALRKTEYAGKPAIEIVKEQQMNLHGWPTLWLETKEYFIDTDTLYGAIRVYILRDGQMLLLQAYGELSPVAEIVNSIRPIQ